MPWYKRYGISRSIVLAFSFPLTIFGVERDSLRRASVAGFTRAGGDTRGLVCVCRTYRVFPSFPLGVAHPAQPSVPLATVASVCPQPARAHWTLSVRAHRGTSSHVSHSNFRLKFSYFLEEKPNPERKREAHQRIYLSLGYCPDTLAADFVLTSVE